MTEREMRELLLSAKRAKVKFDSAVGYDSAGGTGITPLELVRLAVEYRQDVDSPLDAVDDEPGEEGDGAH